MGLGLYALRDMRLTGREGPGLKRGRACLWRPAEGAAADGSGCAAGGAQGVGSGSHCGLYCRRVRLVGLGGGQSLAVTVCADRAVRSHDGQRGLVGDRSRQFLGEALLWGRVCASVCVHRRECTADTGRSARRGSLGKVGG